MSDNIINFNDEAIHTELEESLIMTNPSPRLPMR